MSPVMCEKIVCLAMCEMMNPVKCGIACLVKYEMASLVKYEIVYPPAVISMP